MPGRILSIQSHVTFGYVGGKAAAFPLQCLGYDVDLVNTVNFSNHSGYGRSGGTKTSAEELASIFDAMEGNELLRPERLLTGYIPNATALSAIKTLIKKLRNQNPGLIYLLDPVMGDSGRLYVAADVVPVYRSLLPLSTIITPNWFEVETLTSIPLTSLRSLRLALKKLHLEFGVKNVAISSIPFGDWMIPETGDGKEGLPVGIRPTSSPPGDEDGVRQHGYLLCITSEFNGSVSNEHEIPSSSEISLIHAQHVPLLPGYFSGVGDLFSALVLAHYQPDVCSSPFTTSSTSASQTETSSYSNASCTPLSTAVSLALQKTHSILTRTHIHASQLPPSENLPSDDEKDAQDPLRRIRRMRGRELRLIQSVDIIRGEGWREKGIGGGDGANEAGKVRQLERWEGFWQS